MTRENLSKLNSSVKCTFAKLMLSNGYNKFIPDKIIKYRDLILSYSFLRGNDFEFGAAYQNVRFFKNENEVGITTIENEGLSYRSFINLEDVSSKVFKSIYVKLGENEDESYITTRLFSEDQSLLVITSKTNGKRNAIQELCAYVYDSKDICECIESNPDFNPCEIGEDIKSCMVPSRVLILLPSSGISNIASIIGCLEDYSKLSEVLILTASNKTNGEIPYEFTMNAETITSMFDKEKRKQLF